MPNRRPRHRLMILLLLVGLAGAAASVAIRAADHRDSTLLTANPAVDINDVYAFQSPNNPNNVVFAMTVDPLIPPTELGTHYFEPNALYQLKFDTDADAVEDLVIQAVPTHVGRRQFLRVLGPVAPTRTGSINRIASGKVLMEVPVSARQETFVESRNGIRVFAGVRDDPFFFDSAQFVKIINGQASSFNNPGIDAFAEFNTLAIVFELPASLLGSNPNIGVWATTSRAR